MAWLLSEVSAVPTEKPCTLGGGKLADRCMWGNITSVVVLLSYIINDMRKFCVQHKKVMMVR